MCVDGWVGGGEKRRGEGMKERGILGWCGEGGRKVGEFGEFGEKCWG